jgi:hypothetical protein
MAAMTIGKSLQLQAARARQKLQAGASGPGGVLGDIWHWINSVSSGVSHIIGVDLLGVVKAAFAWDKFAGHVYITVAKAIEHGIIWLIRGLIKALETKFDRLIDQLRAKERKDYNHLIYLIAWVIVQLEKYSRWLVQREAAMRLKGDIYVYNTARKWDTALHQAIEREAVSGYKLGQNQQLDAINRVLDLVANLNPVTRVLVSDLAKGILDVLAVDDPVLRIALGFVVKHVIDRLGLDKPLGRLLGDMLGPILATGHPRSIHDVVADICARLATGENAWAQFMANGGSEVEQAGSEWQKITDYGTDALMLAIFGTMVTDPGGFANDVTGALSAVVHDTTRVVHKLIAEA